MKKIIVTGCNGQLGRAINQIYENSTEFVLASKTLELFKSPFANADNKGKITRYLLTYDENGYITVSERVSGDGKITFASSCQDSRAGGVWHPYMVTPIKWNAIYPVPGGHMGIMNSSFFDAILRHILLDIRNRESVEAQKKGSSANP